jgi:hypothetical protein
MPGVFPFGVQVSQSQGLKAIDPATLTWAVKLDARSITGVPDGTVLTTWPDSSGNGRDAGQAIAGLKPTYRATASANQQPLVDFYAGATIHDMGGTLPAGGLGNAAGFTLYAYYTQDQIDATDPGAPGGFNDQIIWGSDIAGGWRMYGVRFPTVPTKFPSASTGGNLLQGSAAPSLGSHVMVYSLAPPSGAGVAALTLDGVQIATGTWNANPQTRYLVSSNAGDNIGLHGKIGFLGLAATLHSARTQLGVAKFLRQTWG